MRVLLLLDWPFPCNHQFLSTVYSEKFPSRNHEVTWIMRPEDDKQSSIKRHSWNGMDVYTLPSEDFSPLRNYIRYGTKNIRSNSVFTVIDDFEKYDLVHVRNDLAMGLVACHISQKWGVPFVHQISHLKAETLIEEYQRDLGSSIGWGKGQLGKRLRHTISKSADIVLPISEEMKNYLRNCEYTIASYVFCAVSDIVSKRTKIFTWECIDIHSVP